MRKIVEIDRPRSFWSGQPKTRDVKEEIRRLNRDGLRAAPCTPVVNIVGLVTNRVLLLDDDRPPSALPVDQVRPRRACTM